MGRLRAPRRPSARRAAGLTLIELMVVVAIAVIILGLAAPSFSEYIVTQRLRSIHAQMATDLQFARSEAVARSAFVSVRFQEVTGTGGMTCYIIFTRPDPSAGGATCSCTAAPGSRCSTHPTTTTEIRTVTISRDLKVGIRTPPAPPPPAVAQADTVTFDHRIGSVSFALADSGTAVAPSFEVNTSADVNRSLRATVRSSGRIGLCTPSGSMLGGTPC